MLTFAGLIGVRHRRFRPARPRTGRPTCAPSTTSTSTASTSAPSSSNRRPSSESYTLTGNAQLPLLLGAFTLDRRDAQLRPDRQPGSPSRRPSPSTSRATCKVGSTKIGFADGVVTDIRHFPPPVPKRRHHSAARAASQGRARSLERHHGGCRAARAPIPATAACRSSTARSASISCFSYKGEMKVTEQQPSGQPGVAHVCRVQLPADRRPQGRHRDQFHGRQRRHRGGACGRFPAPTSSCPTRSPFRPWPAPPRIVSKRVEIDSRQAADRCCIDIAGSH